MKQQLITSLAVLSLATVSTISAAENRLVNITSNPILPLNLAVEVGIASPLLVGVSVNYRHEGYLFNRQVTYLNNMLKTNSLGGNGYLKIVPRGAFVSGPQLKIGAGYETVEREAVEIDRGWSLFGEADPDIVYQCESNTESTTADIALGYQWYFGSRFNTELNAGYRHNIRQTTNVTCSPSDDLVVEGMRREIARYGEVTLDFRVGFAF